MKKMPILSALLVFSSSVFGQATLSPEEEVRGFLEAMKQENFYDAADFILPSELAQMTQSSLPLLNNDEFLSMMGMEEMTSEDLQSVTGNDLFEMWSYLGWSRRDERYGQYGPQSFLGAVQEGENLAYVVVRNETSSDTEALVYTLERQNEQWRIRLPRIIRSAMEVYLLNYSPQQDSE